MSANGISGLATKRERQDAKLEIAEAKRQGKTITEGSGSYSISGAEDATAGGYRTRNDLNADQLPERYATGDYDTRNRVDGATGTLTAGRPWYAA
jgi:hypothetical protein